MLFNGDRLGILLRGLSGHVIEVGARPVGDCLGQFVAYYSPARLEVNKHKHLSC